MPLPAALLKKLAKRGIVNDAETSEEVILEDYDDVNPENYNYQTTKRNENIWLDKLKRRLTTQKISGVKGCPNKYNVYHVCTLYCAEKYGDGNSTPSKAYKKRFKRLLERYPLPKEKAGVAEWMMIYDPGCASYYFWNKTDDFVTWLPPKHPKAQLSKSAATLRREIEEKPDLEESEPSEQQALPESAPPTEESLNTYKAPQPGPKKPKTRDLEKILKSKQSRKQAYLESEKLDPMDPAAYGDCPRGKWSSGLNTDTKSGVDQSASGTLFQMRPYPSPGEILRANRKRSNSDDEEEKSNEEWNYPKHPKESSGRNNEEDISD